MKRFNLKHNVGKVKYLVSFHNGEKKHKDGSDFFDIACFNNKQKLNVFTNNLLKQGYFNMSQNNCHEHVTVLKTPITERYCKVGDVATLDTKNKQIRCNGAWFPFDKRWVVQPYMES